MSQTRPDIQEGDLAEIRDEVTEPPLYKVLIHNDDYTTKAFVVEVLMKVFSKSMDEAPASCGIRIKTGPGFAAFTHLKSPNQGEHGDGGRARQRLPVEIDSRGRLVRCTAHAASAARRHPDPNHPL